MRGLINASDLAAEAYGRRRPEYPVLTETLGLALVLLVNRSTDPARALWLVHPVMDDVLSEPAEAFAEILEQRPPIDGWRGGALASLRSLVPGAVHEGQDRWPRAGGDQPAVRRIWLEDYQGQARDLQRPLSPVRAQLGRRLAGRERLERGLDALIGNYRSHCAQFASWNNAHEQPEGTMRLRADLLTPPRNADAHVREQPEPR